MSSQSFTVNVGAATTTALLYRSEQAHAVVILAHGAGAPQTHPWIVSMAHALAARGFDVVTFNFLYSESKRRAPDRAAVLEATWRAVLSSVRARGDLATTRVFIGGKSMGGRIATQVAAAGDVGDIAGLVLLGYPLHPPGKPDQLRSAHLPAVKAPMLFVQGSRDSFGTRDELAPVVASLGRRARLFVIDGGDHSLAVPRSAGQTRDQILARVADEIAQFAG